MKKLFLFLFALGFVNLCFTQTMNIHTSSGVDNYNLADVDSITFKLDDILNLQWVRVPAGDYTWGYSDEIRTIDYNYDISKYEITNAQYVTYLENALSTGDITVTESVVEGYYEGDGQWSAGTYEYLIMDDQFCRIDYSGGMFNIISGYENHPVAMVTWFGADAFAKHFGWKLPSEEEWEKTARGNTGYDYPWGDNIDGSYANYSWSGDPYDNGTTPVGYYNGSDHNGFQTADSPSTYGAYDMSGNNWEWTLDFYSTSSSNRVVRGGAWNGTSSTLKSWSRNQQTPNTVAGTTGFRVASTVTI
jgi:formylglycine-generating enzyme required for sulfatase activity